MDPDWRREGNDPDYRFSLANERTFLAWVRTSLALLAASVGLVQLAPDLGASWIRRTVSVVLAATGLLVGVMAYRHWKANEAAMRSGRPLPHTQILALLGAVLGVAGLALVLLVILG